jgi:hypothetical protein
MNSTSAPSARSISQASEEMSLGIETGTLPNRICPPLCRIRDRPSVRINWA